MTKVRRPTAEDRYLASVFRKLVSGEYTMTVEDTKRTLHMRFLRPAKLKSEGSTEITLDDKEILICPKK